MSKNGVAGGLPPRKVVGLGSRYWERLYRELREMIVELEIKTITSSDMWLENLGKRDEMVASIKRRAVASMALQLEKDAASRIDEITLENGSRVHKVSVLVIPSALRDRLERMP